MKDLSRSKTNLTALLLMIVGPGVSAETEIHRCLLDDGTVAFQELPCPEPAEGMADGGRSDDAADRGESPAAGDDAFDFVNPFDEPQNLEAPAEAPLPAPVSGNRAECEKSTRDAIDAIDLEMRQTAYSKEQGREYLQELLALTQQLRACKQL